MVASPWYDLVEPGRAALTAVSAPTIEQVVRDRLIRTVFHPIVSLVTGELVAAEALSRGPANTPLENPLAMLDAAGEAGLLTELDEVFRTEALRTAASLNWPKNISIFLNAEPLTLSPQTLDSVVQAQDGGLRVTVELTERGMTHDLATLLDAGETVRRQGVQIALDDVGVEPASLALIALLRPDVVKLDMGLIRDYPAAQISGIANAVRAYAEESGANVVAEGIETPADLQIARVLGANLGQGWLFGWPASTLPDIKAVSSPMNPAAQSIAAVAGGTPYSIATQHRTAAISTKRLLLPLSDTLERHAHHPGLPPLVLATFQHARHFTPATRHRYAQLAQQCPFVCAIGTGMDSHPAPGVRGGRLGDTDPLTGEWTVIILGPHFAAALIASDLGDSGPDLDRRFSYLVTHDRQLVVAAARSLIRHVVV